MAEAETACRDAYWSGKPWDDAKRDGVKWGQMILEDLFTASIDEFTATMETEDD